MLGLTLLKDPAAGWIAQPHRGMDRRDRSDVGSGSIAPGPIGPLVGRPDVKGNLFFLPSILLFGLESAPSIVRCSMGFDLLGCALLEHARDDRDAAECYHCAPAQNDGTDKDDCALSDRA